jgi:hypothetical protein
MAKDIGRNRLIESEDALNQPANRNDFIAKEDAINAQENAPAVAEDFKGYRSPFGGKNIPIPEDVTVANKEFKGFRGPGGSMNPPAPEVDAQPLTADNLIQPLDQTDTPEFINFFGDTFYRNSKEYKKKLLTKPIERTPASAVVGAKPPEDTGPKLDDFMNRPSWQKPIEELDKENAQKYGDDWKSVREGWEGFKSSYGDVANSIRQIYNYASGDEETLKKLQEQAKKDELTYDSTPGKIGYFLGSASQWLIPSGLGEIGALAKTGSVASKLAKLGQFFNPATVGKMAGLGALQSALSSPTTEGGSEGFLEKKAIQTGIGAGAGALGAGLAKGLETFARPTAKMIGGKTAQEVAKEAERLGVKMLPSQLAEGSILPGLTSTAETLPLGKGVFKTIGEENKKAINKLAVEAIEPGSKALAPTKEFLDTALQKSDEAYNAVRNAGEIKLDRTFKSEVDDLITKVEGMKEAPTELVNKLKSYSNDFIKKTDVPASEGYKQLADQMKTAAKTAKNATEKRQFLEIAKEFSDLGKPGIKIENLDFVSRKSSPLVSDINKLREVAKTATQEEGYVLRQLADSLEQSTSRGLEAKGMGDLAQGMKEARLSRAKIERIRGALDNPQTGELNLGKIFTKSKKDAGQNKFLEDLVSAGSISKSTPFYTGVSPTAEKTMYQNLLAQIGTAGVGGVIGGAASGGDVGGAAIGIGAGLAGSRLLAKALTSEALMNNVLFGIPKINRLSPILKQILPKASVSTAKTVRK